MANDITHPFDQTMSLPRNSPSLTSFTVIGLIVRISLWLNLSWWNTSRRASPWVRTTVCGHADCGWIKATRGVGITALRLVLYCLLKIMSMDGLICWDPVSALEERRGGAVLINFGWRYTPLCLNFVDIAAMLYGAGEVASVGWWDYGRSILLGVIVTGVHCWTFCYFDFVCFLEGGY